MVSVGRAVETWSLTLVADNPDVPEHPGGRPPRTRLVRDIEHARAQLAAVSQHLAAQRREDEGPSTSSWLVVGGVLADLSRILTEIDPAGGAHKSALSPTPGAHLHVRRPSWRPLRRAVRAARRRLRPRS
ncbi:hypothetical protein HUO13_24355 [Saccharopolyspora erythraea]|uniref:hypothetical protein n=1 Tax=Saccharopolyspora erythraea TaxID=1836 RepID=UPI001BA61737|nr:hypothetical protein [Saccharopolyspora erythraea]QUH03531.1 hypothetical protein HUO13_24355 [Saccharopolyspora erythraea]